MAKAQDLSEATIRRIRKQHDLKAHLVKAFKLSRDKQFVEKLHDIDGSFCLERQVAFKVISLLSGVVASRARGEMADLSPGAKHPGAVLISKAVDASVIKLEAAGRFQRYGEHMPEQAAQNATVGDHNDCLSEVLRRNFFEAAEIALHLLAPALSARNDVIGTERFVQPVFLGISALNLLGLESLKDAQVSFSQPLIYDDFSAGSIRDDFSGLVGSTEIAAIESAEALAFQAPGDRLRLSDTDDGQRAIEMTLAPSVQVPCRFAVPDDDDLRLFHDARLLSHPSSGNIHESTHLVSRGDGLGLAHVRGA